MLAVDRYSTLQLPSIRTQPHTFCSLSPNPKNVERNTPKSIQIKLFNNFFLRHKPTIIPLSISILTPQPFHINFFLHTLSTITINYTMSAPPSYAPTSTTSYTPAAVNPGVDYHHEVTRGSILTTSVHKAVYESLCEIYSIITVLEMVENAFLKDFVTDKEKYTSTVMRLINQYQILVQSLGKSDAHRSILRDILPGVANDNSNLLVLLQEKFKLHASLAADRLVSGIPATIEHMHTVVDSSSHPVAEQTGNKPLATGTRLVAESTGNFITIMDALKLNYNTKSQLHPLLSDLVISLNDLVTVDNESSKPIDFPGKSKLVNWLIKLNNLEDSEELLAADCDHFLEDLDSAYKGFYSSLA